ncbi:alpha/beta hydrolase [Sphingomicrobium sp. XHP0239]|uniref:alpha/beta fold hydrolase n=1 Tax=Sphingomicrobium maritimum TaxID=3133972 RepID=UPI0031CC4EAC
MLRYLLACLVLIASPAAAEPTRFSVEVVGEGSRDVILIPGLMSPRTVWDDQVAQLSADNRLHLVQINGFGGTDSGPNADGPVFAGVVDELAAYLEDNDLTDVVLIGHSLGGFASLNLALDRPDRVDRVMIVDSLPFFSILMGAQNADEAAPLAERMRAYLLAQPTPEAGDCTTPSFNAQSMSLDFAGQCKVDAFTASADATVAGQLVYDLATTDARPRLADLKVPVTVLFPYSEPMAPLDQVSRLYRTQYSAAGERVTFVPVDNSRHFVMFDAPDAFASALADFLAD